MEDIYLDSFVNNLDILNLNTDKFTLFSRGQADM